MKNSIFFILICMSMFVNAQTKRTNIAEKYIGIQARLIDLMPFELSYLSIKKASISFAIRGGYGSGIKNSAIRFYSSSSNKNYTTVVSKFDQSFQAFFIKPGIIVSKNRTPIFSSYYLINYSLAQSNDQLQITSNDQLYGTYTNEYHESHVYQSIEFEGNYQLKFASKIYLGLGYILGYKLANEIPFKDVISGIENGSQYSPSQGHGFKLYFNANTSIMYKL